MGKRQGRNPTRGSCLESEGLMLSGGILAVGGGLRSCEPKCGRKVTPYRREWKGIRKPSNSIPSFHRWGDWALNALPEVTQLVSGGIRSPIPVQCSSSISWRQTTQFCFKWHCSQVPTPCKVSEIDEVVEAVYLGVENTSPWGCTVILSEMFG